jgi:molecular chaperone GrpE
MSKTNGHAEIHTEEEKQTIETPEPEVLPAEDPSAARSDAPSGAVAGDPATTAPAAPTANETEKLRAERDALFDRLARLQAEFDNYRKRAGKENADFREYALAEAARSLIPVLDSLALALKNAAANPEDLRKGVELIYKQFQEVMQKLNVQRVEAQGKPFDPRIHEAIEMVESSEVADNHVLEELQAGYRMKDRLLRPAMVRVARNVPGEKKDKD